MKTQNNFHYIWLGIRESDIADTGCFFSGSVTIFGSGKNGNHAMEKEIGKRIDHNGECNGFEEFFTEQALTIARHDPAARFVLYDALDYASFPPELQKRFVWHNAYSLLELLNHKIYTRKHFSSFVKVPPYRVISYEKCTEEALEEMFPDHKSFVLQRDFSCGGSGTYLVKKNKAGIISDIEYGTGTETGNEGRVPVPSDEQILVSPFFERNVSVNIHCMIYAKQTLLFAPSIQLLKQHSEKIEYLGSDYSAAAQLSDENRSWVKEMADAVCHELRKMGYRGICGIDMILTEDTCYFMEVNARFQASSALLNKNLQKSGFPSLLEYQRDAFSHNSPSLPYPSETAAGSFITLHYRRADRERIHWFWKQTRQASDFTVVDDSFDWQKDMEENCYAFQIHRDGQISSITFQNTVRLHPNVSLSPFFIDSSADYDNILLLKLLMLARGVHVTEQAWKLANLTGGVDWYEFDAVTLLLPGDVWVTAPCMEDWNTISPIEIDADLQGNIFWLCLYGKRLIKVGVMQADPNAEKKSSRGHNYRDIVYVNPDRLRVYHRDGCVYQEHRKGCRFCDLYGTGNTITYEEITEALDLYWDDLRVNHFLIGGGSGAKEEEYHSVLRIAEYIHAHSDKHIYLMTTPVDEKKRLERLKESGVTEISFNIEIFDRDIAAKVMPGKSAFSEQYYLESLKNAAEVFGGNGEVRCAVIVGFDDAHTFAEGIRKICEAEAAPILSLYRICPGTELETYMPPDEAEALYYFHIADNIAHEYGLRLGPSCRACQNNTLALEM